MAILKIDLHEYAEKVAEITLDEMQYKGKTLRQWADGITNPKNNADRIRSMTDEELADFMAQFMYCINCWKFDKEQGICTRTSGCNSAMLDWLKQECE